MENKSLIDRLILTFKEETIKLKEKFDECEYNIEMYYKNNRPEKGVHSVDAYFEFDNYIFKLEYKVNVGMLLPKSLLEMRFMLKTGKLPVEYSIYDILDVIENEDFKCYTIPLINSEKQMISAIKYLSKTFLRYKNRIEKISQDNEKIGKLEKNVDDKINTLLNERVFKSGNVEYLTRILELYYIIDSSRYTNDVYLNVLKGKYSAAIKRYKKTADRLTMYEKRLIGYIKVNEIKDILPDNLKTLENAKKLQGSFKEFLSMFLSWVVLTPLWSLVYLLVFALSYYVFNKNAIYTTYSNVPYVILCAFLTAISSYYFFRKKVYKVFFRKKRKELLALDELENTKITNKFMLKFLQFIIAVSLVFTVFIANTNLQFRENEIINNLNLFSIKGEVVEYTDIEKIYKAKYITNDFSTKIYGDIYSLSLKNGEMLDLYYDLTSEEIQKYILPILEAKKIPQVVVEDLSSVK